MNLPRFTAVGTLSINSTWALPWPSKHRSAVSISFIRPLKAHAPAWIGMSQLALMARLPA
jgi:hypothetical protein